MSCKAELAALRICWNRLLNESPRPVPFLTWEWVYTWWEHFCENSRLLVLVARNSAGATVGIAPLRLVRRKTFQLLPVWTIEFLGYKGSVVCSDHLDFITTHENRLQINEALVNAIFDIQGEWDALNLADLAEDSLIPEILQRKCNKRGQFTARTLAEICPYVLLPSTWTNLLTSLKKKRRSFVKTKRQRLLSSFDTQFVRDLKPADVAGQLELLAELHTLSRGRKGERGNFANARYRNFHHAVAARMAEAGYLYIARLDCNGRTVAMVYGYKMGSTLFYYQTGYDAAFANHGVGGVLLGMVMQDAIEVLGITELDFLRGAEPYKYFWTQMERNTSRVISCKRHAVGRISQSEYVIRQHLGAWRVTIKQFCNP